MASLKEYSKLRFRRSQYFPIENLKNLEELSQNELYIRSSAIRQAQKELIDFFFDIAFHLLFINIVLFLAIIISELTYWVIRQVRRLYYGYW